MKKDFTTSKAEESGQAPVEEVHEVEQWRIFAKREGLLVDTLEIICEKDDIENFLQCVIGWHTVTVTKIRK
jgi:hypothetical protein